MTNPDPLSRRERQLMNLIYKAERPTASDLHTEMADPPSYSAVRAHLATLITKGHLNRELVKGRHVYTPSVPREDAGREALQRVVDSFFGGSSQRAIEVLRQVDRDWAQW